MSGVRFDAVGIVVRDMAASVAFYALLGLEFPDIVEDHMEAVLPGGSRFMLDTEELVRSFDESFTPPTSTGRISLAFVCDSPSSVDVTHASVVAAGHGSHLEPFDAFWGQRYATVVDPDGNHVDLFAALGPE